MEWLSEYWNELIIGVAASLIAAAILAVFRRKQSEKPTAKTSGKQKFSGFASGNTANQAGGDVHAPVTNYNALVTYNAPVTNNYITQTVSREAGVSFAVIEAMFLSMGGGKRKNSTPPRLKSYCGTKQKNTTNRKRNCPVTRKATATFKSCETMYWRRWTRRSSTKHAPF